jgi:hypothetical protein
MRNVKLRFRNSSAASSMILAGTATARSRRRAAPSGRRPNAPRITATAQEIHPMAGENGPRTIATATSPTVVTAAMEKSGIRARASGHERDPSRR